MPRLVRLYVMDCLLGLAFGIGFAAALVVLNVGNLGYLVTHVTGGWLAFAILSAFNGLVFAGAIFGIRVMAMQDRGDGEE